MDRTARVLFLQAHALLISLRTRVHNSFRACLNLYSPETWLVLSYPLFYFGKVAKRCPQTAKQGHGMLSDWSFSKEPPQASLHVSSSIIEQTGLLLVILSPFCYVFLLHRHFLDSRSWTTSRAEKSSKSEAESFDDPTNRAAESLLQTNFDIGLTEDQVSERQKLYGPNEILLMTRSWFYVLLRLVLRTTNLVPEVSLVITPEQTADN